MKKLSSKQLEDVKLHVESMIQIISEKLHSRINFLEDIAIENLLMVEKGRLDYINGLGIVQGDGQEIDVLSARLNTYIVIQRFIEDEGKDVLEQLECMVQLVSSDLKSALETLKKDCNENSYCIQKGCLDAINGMGVLQNKGLKVDILSAKLYVYLTVLSYIREDN